MKEHFKKIIEAVGENTERDGLKETPERAARAFEFLTEGYRMDLQSVVKEALFESDHAGIVMLRDIDLFSLCEHHLLPFFGKCHIAYFPKGKVIGLSKMARVVNLYARRLQLQERLTDEIAEGIQRITHSESVAVTIVAKHLCMMMRGVEKVEATMTTSCFLGRFETDPHLRKEFLL